ncbi:hypothetical protein [Nisaea sp.]|uniref:hypothetical protein n=1 Tax=Nisaea sp. TaxID=2024842 RepID=UPI003265A8B1
MNLSYVQAFFSNAMFTSDYPHPGDGDLKSLKKTTGACEKEAATVVLVSDKNLRP